jgi:hypothetical protein
MDAAKIMEILTEAGFQVLGIADDAIVLEAPSCILRGFMSFIDFAWIALGGLTGLMLFGWAVAMIRGSDPKIADKIRNLFLLFGGLATVPALTSFLFGEGILQCDQISVSIPSLNDVLAMKSAELETRPAHFITGMVNEHRMVDARLALSGNDIDNFRRVVIMYGLVIRGCEAEGCGRIGAPRVTGPAMHEGTDLYRAPGEPIPTLFDGTIADIDRTRYGGAFTGILIRNDNGTTSYYLYAADRGIRVGDRVRAGDIIATSQNLAGYREYAGVPNHVHVELWSGAGRGAGEIINTEELF